MLPTLCKKIITSAAFAKSKLFDLQYHTVLQNYDSGKQHLKFPSKTMHFITITFTQNIKYVVISIF